MTKVVNVVYKINSRELDQLKASLKLNEEQAKKLEAELNDIKNKVKDTGDQGSKSFLGFKNVVDAISFAAIGAGLVQLTRHIVQVTAQFQTFEAVLTNTLGSQSKARKALNDIVQFAAKTPFAVEELTSSFVKLANQGFIPTQEEMRKLGDLAASTGKQFDMLTEAIIDAQTGEFERLKEFGIRASKEGDNVTFTFKGVQTQTEFTSQAIRDYVLSLGEVEGVSGSMAAISETLGGKISNLGDNFTQLANNLGKYNKGPIGEAFQLLNDVLGKFNEMLAMANQTDMDIAEIRLTRFRDKFDEIAAAIKGGSKDYTALNQLYMDLTTAINEANQELEDNLLLSSQMDKSSEEYKKMAREVGILKAEITGLREIRVDLQEIVKPDKPPPVIKKTKDEIKELQKAFEDLAKETSENVPMSDTAIFLQSYRNELDAFGKKFDEDEKKRRDDEYNATQEHLQDLEDLRKQHAERVNDIQQELTDFALQGLETILTSTLLSNQTSFDDEAAKFDERIRLAGDNEKARQQIEAEREQAEARFRQRQKEEEKKNAIKKIGIDTAVSIIKTFANYGYTPAGIAFAALAAAQGALQSATVRKYAKGEVNIDGPGTTTSDSIPAMLSRGESVINARATAASKNLLEAINNREIDDRILSQAAKNGGAQVNIFDDSRIVSAIEKSRVDYMYQAYSLYQVTDRRNGLKKIIRSKVFSN